MVGTAGASPKAGVRGRRPADRTFPLHLPIRARLLQKRRRLARNHRPGTAFPMFCSVVLHSVVFRKICRRRRGLGAGMLTAATDLGSPRMNQRLRSSEPGWRNADGDRMTFGIHPHRRGPAADTEACPGVKTLLDGFLPARVPGGPPGSTSGPVSLGGMGREFKAGGLENRSGIENRGTGVPRTCRRGGQGLDVNGRRGLRPCRADMPSKMQPQLRRQGDDVFKVRQHPIVVGGT